MDNDSIRIKVLELSSENTILKYSNQAALQELADAYEYYIASILHYGKYEMDKSVNELRKLKSKHNIK